MDLDIDLPGCEIPIVSRTEDVSREGGHGGLFDSSSDTGSPTIFKLSSNRLDRTK